MEPHPANQSRPACRVLVVNGGRPSSIALAAWLRTHPGLEVAGPAESMAAAVMVAGRFRPDVVLFDFHGLPVSVGYATALFREIAPHLVVFVLTHDASDAMRRRCADAGVAGVFDKTTELEGLVQVLLDLPGQAASGKTDLLS